MEGRAVIYVIFCKWDAFFFLARFGTGQFNSHYFILLFFFLGCIKCVSLWNFLSYWLTMLLSIKKNRPKLSIGRKHFKLKFCWTTMFLEVYNLRNLNKMCSLSLKCCGMALGLQWVGPSKPPSCTHQPAADNIHQQHKALHPPPQYQSTRAGWLALSNTTARPLPCPCLLASNWHWSERVN